MFKRKSINSILWLTLTGLVCAASFLAVACSSNSVKKTNNTIFNSEYNISQENNLKNFIPSECKTYFANNHDALLSLIIDKVVSGYKNDITWDQITFNIDDAIANDNAATLSITYVIKSYWLNSVFVDGSSKSLTVNLNGFKWITVPTDFVDSKVISVVGTNLEVYTVDAVIKNRTLITKWIFVNEIKGNKQNLSENNISLTFSGINKVDGKLTVNYNMNAYWSDRGLINTPVKSFTIAFSDFVKMTQTDEEILANINASGTLNNLQISQYMPVIESLNISNSTRLEIIDQTYLNKIKSTPDFDLLNLIVVSGNQANSTLVLKLSGKYQNITIPEAQSLITISGFKSVANTYDINSSMWINAMYLNSDRYYSDLQTKQTMQMWSTNQWFNYLDEFRSFSGGGLVLDILNAFKSKVLSNVVFENVAAAIAQDNWALFSLKFDYINYKYLNNTWIENNKQSFSYRMDTNKQLTYLNDKEAMEYIGSNQVELVAAETASKYASYWYIQTKNLPEAIETILEVKQIYLQTYFADRQLVIELVENSMMVDDWNGVFSFSYKLVLPDDLSSPYNQASMEVNNCLKLSTYVIDNTQDITFSTAQVKTADPQISMVTRIIQSVKQEYTKDQIDALIVNQETAMLARPEYFRVQSNSYSIYNSEAALNAKFDETLINNIADFRLFSKTVNNALVNVDTNLFDRRTNGGFYLDTLRVVFETNAKAFLTKMNNGFIQYKVPFKYELGLLGYTEDISGFYFYNLSLSELGYN